jgi:hypothetical protein
MTRPRRYRALRLTARHGARFRRLVRHRKARMGGR